MCTTKSPICSHHRHAPAKLFLGDAHHIGHSVEALLSQDLFWCLWQHHPINHGGKQKVALGKRTM